MEIQRRGEVGWGGEGECVCVCVCVCRGVCVWKNIFNDSWATMMSKHLIIRLMGHK